MASPFGGFSRSGIWVNRCLMPVKLWLNQVVFSAGLEVQAFYFQRLVKTPFAGIDKGGVTKRQLNGLLRRKVRIK